MPASQYRIPCHAPCHACQALSETMRCFPCHTYTYDTRQVIPYNMPCAQVHTIYNARYVVPYTLHIPILYTMPCPPSHTINHDMPTGLYHSTCHARQAISYTMPCPSGHTIPCHASQAVPYTMLCPTNHVIYHAMSARLYHIPWDPARPYHIIFYAQAIPYTICDTRRALPYTTPCPQCHTVYHAMHGRLRHIPCHALPYTMLCLERPYPIPCYARQAIPYAMPCPPSHTI